ASREPHFVMPRLLLRFVSLATCALVATASARAQGPLTPPGAPAPTQKSLQEIWDKLGAVEAKAAALEQQNTTLQNQVVEQQFFLATVFQDQLPWRLTPVDAARGTGYYTSLAFCPDGRPAISYQDISNADLRFARFNGTSWSNVTVDAEGG